MKKLWTVAALLAIAAIPIVLANSNSNIAKKRTVAPVAGDSNDIFEWELREE